MVARVIEPDPELGDALQRLRNARGMSQEDVARAAGLTMGAYGNVERAQTAPAWGTVRKIAAALDMTIGELATEVDKQRRAKL